VPGSLSEQQRNEYTRYQGDPDDYYLMSLEKGKEASDQRVCPIVSGECEGSVVMMRERFANPSRADCCIS
jgi:hypothetical protein